MNILFVSVFDLVCFHLNYMRRELFCYFASIGHILSFSKLAMLIILLIFSLHFVKLHTFFNFIVQPRY